MFSNPLAFTRWACAGIAGAALLYVLTGCSIDLPDYGPKIIPSVCIEGHEYAINPPSSTNAGDGWAVPLYDDIEGTPLASPRRCLSINGGDPGAPVSLKPEAWGFDKAHRRQSHKQRSQAMLVANDVDPAECTRAGSVNGSDISLFQCDYAGWECMIVTRPGTNALALSCAD